MKKHDYDKILYRLNAIWQRLREGETLSVKDLAQEFNVSTKTIQRDFNQRLIHKLPIEKLGHKWKVKDGYSIDKNLSFEEDLVLDVLKELAFSMGSSFGNKANTLFSKLQNSHENPIYSKIEIEDISDKTDLIKDLQHSIINFLEVEFEYKNKKRFVEPYKITTFDGYWYLYGKDLTDNRLKTFYIKDIKKLLLSKKIFSINIKALRKLDLAMNIWFEPNNKSFEVRLLVDNTISKYFKRRPLCKSQIIVKEYEDESIEILLNVTSKKELIFELKKWQPNLLVIEPQELAFEIIDISKKFNEKQKRLIN